ncbi:hypothetical protein NE865_12052 [Phthorimaea operculella]|nr:hypothetical protein NE865_12052 [Phthorimaea operculella]
MYYQWTSQTSQMGTFATSVRENPEYEGIRLLKNFTEDHVNPEKCKMKVKIATQVFSEKVASTMGYLAKNNILPKECQDTADVLLFFDALFDSVNGSQENAKKRSGKALLLALKPNSPHNKVWVDAKRVLSSMTFVKRGKEGSPIQRGPIVKKILAKLCLNQCGNSSPVLIVQPIPCPLRLT